MAAGLGFKTFTTGEVLTAADTNGYLMQGVLVFASAAARDAAITSPQEGQCCYLKDTDAVLTYSGAAWVGFDDSNAIQNSIVDAKGDLIAASAADTPARLAVGNNGETLVANSAAATGLSYQGLQAAGKNLLINGALDVWQRGTSFTTSGAYSADRWYASIDTGAGTISQQTTSLPEGFQYSIRSQRTAGTTGTAAIGIAQPLETVTSIPAQSKTVTFSYWAKAGANYSNTGSLVNIRISSGTGTNQSAATMFGGWTGYAEVGANQAITTTWTRYSATYAVPANATQLGVRFFMNGVGTAGANDWFEVTGVQLEIATVATSFNRAGGNIQAELAACQRYYQRWAQTQTGGFANTSELCVAEVRSATNIYAVMPTMTVMRGSPTVGVSGASTFSVSSAGKSGVVAGVAANSSSYYPISLAFTVTGYTAGQAGWVFLNSGGYVEAIAEL